MKLPDINEVLTYYPQIKSIHPSAELFPLIGEDDFKLLCDGIENKGLLMPLMLTESGELIDGRSRLMACFEVGQEIRTETRTSDPYDLSLSANLERRQLSVGQKAMIALEVEAHYAVEAKKAQLENLKQNAVKKDTVIHTQSVIEEEKDTEVINLSPRTKPEDSRPVSDLQKTESVIEVKQKTEPVQPEPTKSRDKAAKTVGVSGMSVSKAKKLSNEAPELAKEVMAGNISLEKATKENNKIQKSKPKPVEQRVTIANTTKIVAYDGETVEINKPKKVMFNKTNDNVDWAGYTWNPVTGCLHGCKFCYAEEIANMSRMKSVYPLGFKPVFHEYRLDAPKNTAVDGRVFVCSMADLFGKWIPDEWIERVFESCMSAPEWEYMFLTKWPKRYNMLDKLPKAWFGASIIQQVDVERVERDMQSFNTTGIKWISLEPMLEPIIFNDLSWCDVVVIGSQTQANGQPAFAPDFDWIVDVVNQCRDAGVKYYLKPNLMEVDPGMKLPRDMPSLN